LAIEVKAPERFSQYLNQNTVTIFAGGSIEMNTARFWQKDLVEAFRDHDDVVILNPRRDDWNAEWKQTRDDPNFYRQVNWELLGLEECSAIIMYFDPATRSPVSLLELGLFAFDFGRSLFQSKLHVICPEGFWRKGNVDIVCERYDIPQFGSLELAADHIKTHLNDYRYIRSHPSML
jgi:Nucleoside 2-deoxyribosyltransferase like